MAMAEVQRAMGTGSGDMQTLMALVAMAANPDPHLAELPVRARPLLEKQWPWWRDILTHPARDAFWQELSIIDRIEDITAPALNIGGWFDIFASNTARTFTELRKRGGSAEAREGARLIIGPWDHLNSTGVYPDRKFGLMADALYNDLTGAHQRFFDRWLRGREGATAGDAPVRIFVMGIDQWRDEQDWPLPDTTYTDYFLDSLEQQLPPLRPQHQQRRRDHRGRRGGRGGRGEPRLPRPRAPEPPGAADHRPVEASGASSSPLHPAASVG